MYCRNLIDFIHRTGLNIYSDRDAKTLSTLPDAIDTLGSRIISFIKKRESIYFDPMKKGHNEMMSNFRTVIDSLDSLDLVDYSLKRSDIIDKNKRKTDFKIPENLTYKMEDLEVENDQKKSVQIADETTLKSDLILEEIKAEKEALLDDLDKVKSEKELFKKELEFLTSKLKQSSLIGSTKFTCNISNKDFQRIKQFLSDY